MVVAGDDSGGGSSNGGGGKCGGGNGNSGGGEGEDMLRTVRSLMSVLMLAMSPFLVSISLVRVVAAVMPYAAALPGPPTSFRANVHTNVSVQTYGYN